MSEKINSGTLCPVSGQYGVVGPRGGARDREVTVSKGERMPPTQKPGEGYVLNDATKHKK